MAALPKQARCDSLASIDPWWRYYFCDVIIVGQAAVPWTMSTRRYVVTWLLLVVKFLFAERSEERGARSEVRGKCVVGGKRTDAVKTYTGNLIQIIVCIPFWLKKNCLSKLRTNRTPPTPPSSRHHKSQRCSRNTSS